MALRVDPSRLRPAHLLDDDFHGLQRTVPVHLDVTTTVPCMNGWMEQMYGYVPGLEKVWA